jgi:hypothetical protein
VLETTLLLEFDHQLALVIGGLCRHHVVIVTSSNMKSKIMMLTWGSIRRTRRIPRTHPCGRPSCTFCRRG